MHAALAAVLYVLGAYLAICVVLAAMGAAGLRVAGFAYRMLMSYLLLAVCAAYGGTAAALLRLVGMHRISQWVTARAFKLTMGLATGVTFDVVAGQEYLHTRPAVFVGNHQTALDVLMLGVVFPKWCSVTAKKQLRKIPIFGWYMSLSGTVFIDRGNRSTALKAFEGAAHEISNKRQSVFIFPEGTRSNAKEPMLLPFKKGAFHLAVQAQVPIVPMVSACYWGVLAPQEWRYRSGRIPIIVLPPIPTTNLQSTDVDELTIYVRNRMLHTLKQLTRSKVGRQAWEVDPPPLTAPAATVAAQERLMDGAEPQEAETEKQIALKKKIGL